MIGRILLVCVVLSVACAPRRAPSAEVPPIRPERVLYLGARVAELVAESEAAAGRAGPCVVAELARATLEAARLQLVAHDAAPEVLVLPAIAVDASRCGLEVLVPVATSLDGVPAIARVVLEAVGVLVETSGRCELRRWGAAIAAVLEQLVQLVHDTLSAGGLPAQITLTGVRVDAASCE